MTAAGFSDWSRRPFIAVAAAMLFPYALAAQEPRPLELRSWAGARMAKPSLAFSGDLTNCTLVRCDQTASLFASGTLPFDIGLTTGIRMNDAGMTQLDGRSVLGSVYLSYGAGPLRIWSGANAGRTRRDAAITPDPAPGVESGLSVGWRRVGVALSAAAGRTLMSVAGNRTLRAPPATQHTEDSLGTHPDSIYPSSGDSTAASTSTARWSSMEARITWREDRWWITARAGRLASTRQSVALWAGVQAGRELSRGVSLLLGAGTSSRALTYAGQGSASPHLSVGFGFNTGVLSHDEVRGDSSGVSGGTAQPFTISDLGGDRRRVVLRLDNSAARSVEIACDCDQWTPVPMVRVGSLWLAELRARPGLHHVSIRVDGAGWTAPPGLAPIDDDFAGHTGLLVVP
jgi:hypothetical protein